MGVSQSSFGKPGGAAGSAAGGGAGGAGGSEVATKGSKKEEAELWVTLKAKTTCKRTRAVKTKKVAFRATRAGTTLGAGASCDVVLEDSYLSPAHAVIAVDEAGRVVLTSSARTYWLIGQGGKLTTGMHPLCKSQVVKMGACSLQVTDTCVKPREREEDKDTSDRVAEAGEVCYICFDDSSTKENALVPSPCSCSKLVHRACLSRWIATKGSRLCSICKSKLPIDFTVDAPYLVMQVVRHMRGLHWAGEREYIISFNQRTSNVVTVGSGTDCDLVLPDPSLSRCHARVVYTNGCFNVEDLSSSAGTFLKLVAPHTLPMDEVAQFKMGRTMLSLKVKRKKSMLPWRN